MTTFTLDTLCEKLIKTYNTTIIDQMDITLQQALYSNVYCPLCSFLMSVN